jgi:hypothetical protein
MVAGNVDCYRNPNEMMTRELAAVLSDVSFAKARDADSCSVRKDSHHVSALNDARCFDVPTQICGVLFSASIPQRCGQRIVESIVLWRRGLVVRESEFGESCVYNLTDWNMMSMQIRSMCFAFPWHLRIKQG